MTTATKKATTAKTVRCKLKADGCKGTFRAKSSVEKYCPVCKPLAKNATRRAPYKIPTSNHFFIQLAKEAERAGTLDVFKQLKGDVQALTQLYHVVCFRMKANLAVDKDTYHISHIAPVKGTEVLGAFHPANVVITTAERNKRHGVNHFNNAGVFIDRSEASRKAELTGDESWADLIDKVVAYIGEKTVTEFAKACKLKESTKTQLKKKLEKLVDINNPSHAEHIRVLRNSKSTILHITNSIAAIEGKDAWTPSFDRYSETEITVLELARHSQYREDLVELSAAVSATYGSSAMARVGHMTTEQLDMVFDILHGEEIGIDVVEWMAQMGTITKARTERLAAKPVSAPVVAQVFVTDELLASQGLTWDDLLETPF